MKIEELVLKYLTQDEPDYEEAAKLGLEALPYLKKIIMSEDFLMASKATHLSSLIDDSQAVSNLEIASKSQYPEVRLAAANGIKNILAAKRLSEKKENFDTILNNLKNDSDVGVKKAASKALEISND